MLEKQEPSANTKMDVSTDEITERRKPRIVVKEGSIVPRKGHTQKRDIEKGGRDLWMIKMLLRKG